MCVTVGACHTYIPISSPFLHDIFSFLDEATTTFDPAAMLVEIQTGILSGIQI